jgi:DNA ligase (NAD+)
MSRSPRDRMKELAEAVRLHRYRYYVLDQPTVSDAEYDALEKELRDLEAAHPDLADPNSPTRRVGAPPVESFEKVRHRTPLYSLDNAYNEEDLAAWYERVLKANEQQPVDLVGEIKVDGLSLALTYERRELVLAVTRGDGEVGENVTENARTIADIPLTLPSGAPDLVEVRGEVFLSRVRWEELNVAKDAKGEPRFANPRNAASGSMKLLDSREVAARRLQFLPWQWVGEQDHFEAMAKLVDWGFSAMPERLEGVGLEPVQGFIARVSERRESLGFDLDGVVIKVRSHEPQQRLGFTRRAGPSPSSTPPPRPPRSCWASPGRSAARAS